MISRQSYAFAKMTRSYQKYLQICAFDSKFYAKHKPRYKSVFKRILYTICILGMEHQTLI